MLRLSTLCLGGRSLGKSRKVIIATTTTGASHRSRLRKTASQRVQHKSHKARPLHELIRLAPLQSTQGLRELEASLAMKGELSKATINSLAKLPPQAHMVLLDCTHSHTPGHNDRIVSATLIAHIHQLLQAYVTRITKAGELTTLRRLASCPLLVLVRTQLSREDAEVQQWVLRNALHMQPVQGPFSVSSKPVEPVVWVMDAKESAQLAASPLLAQYDSLSVCVSATGELEASTTTPAKVVEKTNDVTPIQVVSESKPTMTNTAVTKAAEKTSVVTAGQKPAKSAQTVITSTARRAAERREVSSSKGGDTKAPASEAKALTTTTAVKQVAQAGKEENENDMEMKAALQAASEAVQASLPLTASQHTTTATTGNTALAPIETEKELWRSGAKCPVRLTLLRRVLSDSAYTGLEHKLTAKPGALHVLLIRLGTYSTVQSTWRSGLEGVRSLYAQLTGRAVDDVRFFMTPTTTTTATSESTRSRSRRGRHGGSRSDEGNATMTPIVSSPQQQQQVLLSSAAATNAAPRIVLLVHGNHLKSEDAAVFAAGLQEQYKTLTAEVQAEVLLDVQLVPAQRITERSLVHLLREGTTTTTATPSSLFTEVYERLAENEKQKEIIMKKESEGEAEALVRQSIWVAAMLQTLLRRHEAALRTEFDASVAQMRQQQADNEELSRAAQKVEFKAMMIDAVEEVSLRHEQATAHLVKTLSSMVGQWSAEKFVDGLESVIKEQLKPMHGTLETMKKALDEEGKSVWNECAEEIAEVQEMIGETQNALLNKMIELHKESQQREAKVQAAQHKASQDTARHTITSVTNTVAQQMRELKEDVKPLVETSVERGVRAALPTASALAAQEELNCAKLEKCIEVAVGRVWRRLRLGRYVATSMGTLDRNGNSAKSSVMSRPNASNAHITKVNTTPLAPVPLPPLPSEVLTAPVTQAEMRQMLVAALKPIQQTMQREVRERVRGEAAQAVAAALERKGESAAKDNAASERKD